MLLQKVYIYLKMHDIDSRFVTGPVTILFADWGGEEVNGAVTKPSMTS